MGVKFSEPVHTYPGTYPASYTVGTGSFSGRQERGFDHLTPSSAEVEERVELYLYSPSGLSWPVLGWTFTFTFTILYIILPSTLGLYLSGFPTKTLYTHLLFSIRATCPAQLIRLDLITRIIFGAEYRSLSSSLRSFPHSPVTSSLLGQMFSSAISSQTSSAYTPPSKWTTKFHLHICRSFLLCYIWYPFLCIHKIISQKTFYSE